MRNIIPKRIRIRRITNIFRKWTTYISFYSKQYSTINYFTVFLDFFPQIISFNFYHKCNVLQLCSYFFRQLNTVDINPLIFILIEQNTDPSSVKNHLDWKSTGQLNKNPVHKFTKTKESCWLSYGRNENEQRLNNSTRFTLCIWP